jgi:hypothetical protein
MQFILVKKYRFLPAFILVLTILGACSPERTNFLSVTYHNLTAHYNAYFIAREHLKDVNEAIADNHQNNYNKILMVFPEIDSAIIKGKKENLEDIIEKSSLAIQRHKNSKWVDDSWILVGIARYYQADFQNAVETFKFVNTHSEDNDARHKALIYLMRTFIDNNEHSNAIYVSDFLKKEKLQKDNYKNLLLTRAYLYQLREDYNNMVQNLVLAVPLMKNRDGKSRIHYIIGQIYQMLGFDAEAYNNYSNCLKSNPDYELSFYAKLNMAQVTELSKNADIKKVRKYFRSLLKDSKNKEFKDKIYYEMAEFEMKQDNLEGAIEHYKASVASSVNNPRQKGYSFLRLAELNYENFKKYENAKAYYDSVVMVLPQDDERFRAVKERQEILVEFVEQINTITLQDSLLQLSELDSVTVMGLIENTLDEREKNAEKLVRRQQNQKRNSGFRMNNLQNNGSLSLDNATTEGDKWYFYNLSASNVGQSEFNKVWGNRKLEDNWRRSSKESGTITQNQVMVENTTSQVIEVPVTAQDTRDNEQLQMFNSIPFSPEARIEAHVKLEEAYFKLGNIYNFQLDEKKNSAETFETLLVRYPESGHRPETLYLLYLIYKSLDSSRYETHKNDLIENFPNTTYAKLILNPNYREESNLASEKLQSIYREAYFWFEKDSLDRSQFLVDQALKQFPDNAFNAQLELLSVLIKGKREGVYNYQFALNQYIDQNPDTDLRNYADQLLAAIETHKMDLARREGVRYRQVIDGPQYFVMVYNVKDNISESLINGLETFLKSYEENPNLRSSNMILQDPYSIILATQFDSRENAMQFYEKINAEESFMSRFKNYKIDNFVITKENFQILYTTKGLDFYVKFFNKNYQQN